MFLAPAACACVLLWVLCVSAAPATSGEEAGVEQISLPTGVRTEDEVCVLITAYSNLGIDLGT